MRAKVTLRGLRIEREPGQDEVVEWRDLERAGDGVYVQLNDSGEPLHKGMNGCIRLNGLRECGTANRLHSRAFKAGFRSGSLRVSRSFNADSRHTKIMSWIFAAGCVALVALALSMTHIPWYARAGMLAMYFVPFVGIWWSMWRPLPYFGDRAIRRVIITATTLTLERRSGAEETLSWVNARSIDLSAGIPRIEFLNGEVVRIPPKRQIRQALKLIQSRDMPRSADNERRASARSLLRSAVYCVLGGVAAGWVAWWVQQQGLAPSTRAAPIAIAASVSLGLPSLLGAQILARRWMEKGRPPWKKDAWLPSRRDSHS